MCGIVAYIGPRRAQEFLIEGLRRLEYRGYDSAGIATLEDQNQFLITKTTGRISELANRITRRPSVSGIGIGHTRWATHGAATEANAHPHVGGDDTLALAHNGVIENYAELKVWLQHQGHKFRSETDTEVISHLIAHYFKQGLDRTPNGSVQSLIKISVDSIKTAIARLRGTYGLAVIFREQPNVIYAARLGSPLVIGVGDGEHFLASDPSPLLGHTEKIVYLADNQVAAITADELEISHRDFGVVEHDVKILELTQDNVELGEFEHYMLKEIFEQPQSLRNTMRGRLNLDDATPVFGGLNLTSQQLRQVNRIVLTACGSSWHSALVGEYLFEEIAQLPVEVEYASELRYRNPPMNDNTLVFAITQSGETADTLAALREMKRKGHSTLAICNVVGSSIAQEADGGIYLHAGPEIGVASTKAYTSQCLALTMLAIYFGRLHHLSYNAGRKMLDRLEKLPDIVELALKNCQTAAKHVAKKYLDANNFLYLGRQYNFPTALEGALKLKEISYIHAEGYPAAEMKHGPIALVDEHTPSVFVMPQGFIYEKVMSNLEEIKARGGPIIAIAAEGDTKIEDIADDVIFVPQVDEFLQPIVTVLPLQLLAYHMAVLRGCDVDKPRNLAKSVTVE